MLPWITINHSNFIKKRCKLILINARIITWMKPNEILEGKAIHIVGDKINAIKPQAELLVECEGEDMIDAQGQFVMPGLICAHTHFYGAFSRGLAIPTDAPASFTEILRNLWWSLDRALDAESVYYSALVSMIDAIRHGTTTLLDHHASPNFIDGSLDVIAGAVKETGLRASLCYEVSDRNGIQGADLGIEENVRFIQRIISGDNLEGKLAATFGLHASLTLSEETLVRAAANNPEQSGFHIHVAEDIVDQYDSLKKSKIRVVDRLNQHGILGDKSIVAHAVHVDAREILLLAESGTWVTHQPRSNMNNAVGIGNVESMMRMGVKMCLGNDGYSNTMWDEWKMAYLVHKLVNKDPRRMNGTDVVEMGAYQNANLASKQFGMPIGMIKEGAQADLIFVDYQPFTPLHADNLPWHIIFGMQHSMITTTMVAGRILYRNGSFLTIDEKEVIAKAMESAKRTWKQYQELF